MVLELDPIGDQIRKNILGSRALVSAIAALEETEPHPEAFSDQILFEGAWSRHRARIRLLRQMVFELAAETRRLRCHRMEGQGNG